MHPKNIIVFLLSILIGGSMHNSIAAARSSSQPLTQQEVLRRAHNILAIDLGVQNASLKLLAHEAKLTRVTSSLQSLLSASSSALPVPISAPQPLGTRIVAAIGVILTRGGELAGIVAVMKPIIASLSFPSTNAQAHAESLRKKHANLGRDLTEAYKTLTELQANCKSAAAILSTMDESHSGRAHQQLLVNNLKDSVTAQQHVVHVLAEKHKTSAASIV